MLVLWHLLAALPFLLLMAILSFHSERLGQRLYCLLMLTGFGVFTFVMGIVVAAWVDFIGHLFPIEIRGKVMGVSITGFSLAGTAGALVAGWWLKAATVAHPFAWLYLAAWLLGSLSILLWCPVDDPVSRTGDDEPRLPLRELLARFRHSLTDCNFREFLLSRVLATCGFCILPFIAVHYTSTAGGGLPHDLVVSAYAALTLGLGAGSLALGWMGDRRGHRCGVLVGTTAQVVALLVLLFVTGRWGCILAYVAAGVCSACGFVSHYNLILESCPHDNRMAHISVANLLVGLPLAVVPILAGLAAESWGLRPVFLASLGCSVLALLWVVCRVREPRVLGLQPD
jgi:MFS family permease